MNFDFISDEKFRTILSRDFDELTKCLDAKASKSVLILSGSIIESILTDYFSNFPPNGLDPKKVLTMDLATLIDLALENSLISQSTKELSTVIKNFRNLIHPGREIRKNEKFDYDSAIVAKSLLNIVLKEIKENYINNIGHTAIDIISKLENDSISKAIFEKITFKLHKNEKVRLYNLLVEYDLKATNHQTQLTEPKKYVSILKSQIDREVVVNQLMKLVNKIETGEKWEVMTYFYLLYDDLNYLEVSNIELILLYVLNVLTEAIKNEQETEIYVNKRLFSTFGTHLQSKDVKKEFFNLACKIVSRHTNSQYIYFAAYDQLINSIDSYKKEEIKKFIIETVASLFSEIFYEGYCDGNYAPF